MSVERLIREKLRRQALAQRANTASTQLLDTLFPEQREFVLDPSREKSAVCSRRAGKTTAACVDMLSVAVTTPGAAILYIALTRKSAKGLAWAELKRINHRFRLGIRFNHSDLVATLPNGSTITVTGAHDTAAIEVLRGQKYNLVYVDECASYGGHFEALVQDVLAPALMDLRGTMALIGTPGYACAGYFYDRTAKQSSFSKHAWTVLQNPYLAHAAEELERELKTKGWDRSHPTIQREWLGLWSRALDSLVYSFDPDRNTFTDLPEGQYANVLGVDLGFNDAFVISVLRYSLEEPKAYVVDVFSRTHATPSQWAEWVDAYATRYEPTSIAVDAGGLGKAIVEEMRDKWMLPVKPAEKNKKPAYIEMLNGDLKSGRLMVHSTLTKLADQMTTLQWDEKHPGLKENEEYPNDECDATLYAWRECRHHLNRRAPEPPKEGTPEWRAELEQKLRELTFKRARQTGLSEESYHRDGDAELRRGEGAG